VKERGREGKEMEKEERGRDGPMAITSFNPTHGTRRGRGMVVLENPLGLESKKIVD